jgi:hypothetical protein
MWWTGRGRQRHLQFIHNVRPALALADPPMSSRVPLLMTVGILVGLAALLLFVLAADRINRLSKAGRG